VKSLDNSLPFSGTVLEDFQKMAVIVNSICTAIQNMTDCNTVCSMLQQMQPEELSLNQGRFLIEAVSTNRYDLLTAMVRNLNFSVDSVYPPFRIFPPDFIQEGTALMVSAFRKNRQMSKFLIQELKADVNKIWPHSRSQTTCSVLTGLIQKSYLDELKFFLVSI
jgi:hypothetical protein